MAESGESGAAAEGGGARPRAGLRRLPGVDRLLERPATAELVRQFGHPAVVAALREAVNGLRQAVLDGTSLPDEPDSAALAAAEACLVLAARPTLRRAVNATGVVLHTGLGRAVLAEAALQAALEAGRSHALLEVDPESGERGNRQDHIRPLLCGLTGAEDGLAVNNNAAAVFLALSALASDREVVIARGQLVEIGGSFRIPDVIRQSGARLVEVGTTNRVRLSDYAAALTPDTALILRVHPSNFRIVGFTAEPPLEEMVRLGRERGVPVMDDLGSGALVDLSRHGLRDEPTVQQSVQAGADVVTFSGDKLLGGPQAGLIAGRRGLLARMIQHPLMRVVRLDKVTLAALCATLRLYRDPEAALTRIPTLAALTAPSGELEERVGRLHHRLQVAGVAAEMQDGISQVGGGSLPGEELPTSVLAVDPGPRGAAALAQHLRVGEPSIWTRVHRDRVLIDLRTVTEPECDELEAALLRWLQAGREGGTGQ